MPVDNRPSIVLIVIDDADRKVLEHHASVQIRQEVRDAGATASQYLVNAPQCAPSRASMFRGRYPQNTGVPGNGGAYGNFKDHGGELDNFGVWLKGSGYRTGMVGKYMNGYHTAEGQQKAPPAGWDEWFVVGEGGYSGLNYVMNDNGTGVAYGNSDDDYLTDVLLGRARDFLDATPAGQPFLLVVTPMAPHNPATPARRHKDKYDTELYPTQTSSPPNPSFNEADVSDKPFYISKLDTVEAEQITKIHNRYQDRLECMESLSELVVELINRLGEVEDRLENTYVFFTSDNGYHMGEHRLGHDAIQDEELPAAPGGKNTMYEEDIRVPLWVRGPGIAPASDFAELVGNVDLAPTFRAIAGIPPDPAVDGRSMLPLLQGQTVPWRNKYLINRGQSKPYAGIRTNDYVFAQFDNAVIGEVRGEFYDLLADPAEQDDWYDPAQLENRYHDLSAGDLAALQASVAAYRTCAGDSCRIADST